MITLEVRSGPDVTSLTWEKGEIDDDLAARLVSMMLAPRPATVELRAPDADQGDHCKRALCGHSKRNHLVWPDDTPPGQCLVCGSGDQCVSYVGPRLSVVES